MAERCPLPVTLYLSLAGLAGPVFKFLHHRRVKAGKDDPARGGERFGIPGQARPDGALVWIHAASVGETTSVLPLITRLVDAGTRVLLTSVTRTSAELAAERLPEGAIHQYAPFDNPAYWSVFLDAWRPDLAICVESEIWPASFRAVKARGIPLCLVNARMSERSRGGWARLPRSARHVFSQVDLALAQSPADGERLKDLGCNQVALPGNLKFDAEPHAPDQALLDEFRGWIGGRPVWLAALTHPGEDEVVLSAHKALRDMHPGLLLLLVPRHPARADDIARLVSDAGLNGRRRSLGETIQDDTDVYIGDTLGEMGLFYAASELCFLGGSFNSAGGHNPLEPAHFGTAIVTGPRVANARTVYRTLWEARGALRVDTPDKLADAVAGLLNDPGTRAHQAEAARDVIAGGRGALDRTLDLLAPYLPRSIDGSREIGL